MYKYTLEKYKGIRQKSKCPSCGKNKFVKYIISATGNYLADHVGRCDRSDNCSYHYKPSDYFKDGGERPKINDLHIPYKSEIPNFLDYGLIKKSQKSLDENLIKYLGLSREDCEYWKIGTINLFSKKCIIFWQLDNENIVHAGKIMGYSTDGHRCKKENHSIHKLIYGKKEYNIRQCFFGQHLITHGVRETVNIVESEKTAIWAWKKFAGIWLAAGSMNGINQYKIRMLSGKNVILWPDTGKGLEKWTKDMQLFGSTVYSVKISEKVIEANEMYEEGLDIMDYLI